MREAGDLGSITRPLTPTSSVSVNSLASFGEEVQASIPVLEPWNSAMRFSSGMIFQFLADITAYLTLFLSLDASFRSLWPPISTSLPMTSWSSMKSLSFLTMALKMPSRLRPASSSLTMMLKNPLSRAAVTIFFLPS